MISQTADWAREIPLNRIVGRSDAMRRVERAAGIAAREDANVLVTGERGVGKTVVARLIHEESDRQPYGLATLKCAGLPDRLVQSALFGHAQGSFGGAYKDKPGLLESIPGGTVYLEDVDALSPLMQARLLRFLATGEYQRVGGNRVQTHLDVRVIASTTANLPARVAGGLFLDTLYRRLNVIHLPVPPLRERRDDITALVDHFAGELIEWGISFRSGCPQLSSAVRESLYRADWPGNLDQLKSVVQRQILIHLANPMTEADQTWRCA